MRERPSYCDVGGRFTELRQTLFAISHDEGFTVGPEFAAHFGLEAIAGAPDHARVVRDIDGAALRPLKLGRGLQVGEKRVAERLDDEGEGAAGRP